MTSKREGGNSVDTTTIVLAVIAAVLLLIALRQGRSVAAEGLLAAWHTVRRNLLLLILGFLLAGLVQVLIPRDLITRWLGEQAGVRGILIGCVAGGLFPGSPYGAFPVVASLYQAGASIGAVVGFVTAWALWSVSRLPVEIALISPRPALMRYAVTFVVPPVAGFLAEIADRMV